MVLAGVIGVVALLRWATRPPFYRRVAAGGLESAVRGLIAQYRVGSRIEVQIQGSLPFLEVWVVKSNARPSLRLVFPPRPGAMATLTDLAERTGVSPVESDAAPGSTPHASKAGPRRLRSRSGASRGGWLQPTKSGSGTEVSSIWKSPGAASRKSCPGSRSSAAHSSGGRRDRAVRLSGGRGLAGKNRRTEPPVPTGSVVVGSGAVC